MPKLESHFEHDYSEEIAIKCEHIKVLCNETRSGAEIRFTVSDVKKAVSKLNNGKSADEFGLHAEHFKAGGDIVVPLLVALFNDILKSGSVPHSFKSGILTPVHKKDKDPSLLDNYRGITVTATLGKAGLGGSVGCAVRLETRRSRVQPPPRSATFFRGDWSWNIFYGHSLPSADSRRAVVSFWRKNVHNTG